MIVMAKCVFNIYFPINDLQPWMRFLWERKCKSKVEEEVFWEAVDVFDRSHLRTSSLQLGGREENLKDPSQPGICSIMKNNAIGFSPSFEGFLENSEARTDRQTKICRHEVCLLTFNPRILVIFVCWTYFMAQVWKVTMSEAGGIRRLFFIFAISFVWKFFGFWKWWKSWRRGFWKLVG